MELIIGLDYIKNGKGEKMKHFKDSSLLVEKYRPQSLDDIVLTEEMRQFFKNCIAQKDIPHLLFYGEAGIGKTSLASILSNELKADFKYINGSKNRGIDVLRGDITNFISTYSMDDSEVPFKIVFIDEAEKITKDFQEALKVDMEEMSQNARFIFSTNNISKIIDPIRSRCEQGTFNLVPTDREKRVSLAMGYAKRLLFILDSENIKYDKTVVMELVKKKFPDFRSTVGAVNKFTKIYPDTPIDKRILEFGKGLSDELLKALVGKDVKELRKLAMDISPETFYKEFDEVMYKIIKDTPENIVRATGILSQYSFQDGFSVDESINLKACLLTLAASVEFQK